MGAVLGLVGPIPAWRPALVGAAGGLLLVAVGRLLVLARAEWRREAPPSWGLLAVALLLTGALVLVGAATSGG